MLGVLAGSSLAQSSSDGDHAQRLKFEIWQRGLPECGAHGSSANSATDLSALQLRWMYTRSMPIAALRGGSDGCVGTACEADAVDLEQLRSSMAILVVPGLTALWAPEQSLRRLAPAVQPRSLSEEPPRTLISPHLDYPPSRRAELGPEFGAALERNVRDHEADCEASCEHFYCGTPGAGAAPLLAVRTHSHSMGSVRTHY